MLQDRFSRWEQQALNCRDNVGYDTVCFFRNVEEIYSLYEEWKDKDRFYFIPLKLQLTYYPIGHTKQMTGSKIYLGTFIRTVLEHEDQFSVPCPQCGRKRYPYAFLGPSVNRIVNLEATCPCGWEGNLKTLGWATWNVAFRTNLKFDEKRLKRVRFFHPRFQAATIKDLMDFLWQ